MSRILLLAKLTPQSGNMTTAERIKAHLPWPQYDCILQNTEDFQNQEHLRCYVIKNKFQLVIGIHLWRAGKLLLDCPIPFCIICGGTDLNQHAQDEEMFKVMTKVVEQVKILVAFSDLMAYTAQGLWAAVFTHRLEDFTEEKFFVKMAEFARADETVDLRNAIDNKIVIVFLLVAGLRPVKDPMFLFKALSDWHKDDRRVYLVVVGPEIDAEFAIEVKLSAQRCPGVVVMPALTQPELQAAMKHCATAVVNSSRSEGMSSAILEAMDLETVVIARKIPGNEYLIKHNENGLLFETPKEFVSLAKQVVSNDRFRQRLAANGKKCISENHSLSTERNTYQSIARNLEK